MQWYIALSGSIIVIMICIYLKLNIGLTMILGAVFLGLLSRLPAISFTEVLFSGLWSSITIMLVASILLLGVLGDILKKTGAMDAVIVNLNALVVDVRVITAAMPMLIGMLTVPGGAILSAPLCAEAGNKMKISPEKQSVINNWFRHVLYFMFPLFPSLIITAELSGVSISNLVMHNFLLTIIGIIFGFFYLFKGFSGSSEYKQPDSEGNEIAKTFTFSRYRFRLLFKSIMPLLIVFGLVVFIDLYFPLALLIGIIFALLNYLPGNNWSWEILHRLRTMIIPGIKLHLVLVIVGIMLYKEMLTYTGVIADMTDLVISLGIPVIILITVIPFLVGLLVGDNSASVAILLPLFIPLVPSAGLTYSAYIAFLYASSTAGHIVSPAHPCFSLTNEYYKVDIRKVFIMTLPMLAVVIIAGFLITIMFGIY